MNQVHGHEVLAMMQGKAFSVESLRNAMIEKFGENTRYFTCSASDMTADELIQFLMNRGKFMPMDDGFTVDKTKICNHNHEH